jgi:basic membrane lipoprotein Med (substrate-binding protein (PBP1-ABC) superfamily)
MKTLSFKRILQPMLALLITSVILVACGGAPAAAPTTAPAAGATNAPAAAKKVKVGFLYVGPVDDYGYNYAADQGRLAMQKTLGDQVETVMAENVPEDANAERVMEQMIKDGATIIFPTSYGHFGPAANVSKKYPDITFLHQGGLQPKERVSSFFGEIWQMVYASGVAAGKMTKSNKLGYIVAFPIPQTLLNINAFELGAKSVNPSATTTVVFTASWCDPAKNSEAANSLIDQGIDVLTQHQDCPKPVIEVAEKRGVMSVGYHADASPVAPKGWITAAIWNWGPLYTKLTQQAIAGDFKAAKLMRFGVKDDVVTLAPFGANVPKDVQDLVLKVKKDITDGTIQPFKGPIKDQDGKVRIEGAQPDTVTLETTDYLVEGVIGTLPK